MTTRLTTRVIVYHWGKILLCRNTGQNFWYPGGGGLEETENLIECAKREVWEETGQRIKILDLMYFQEFYLKKGERSLEFFFLAKPIGKIIDNKKHSDTDSNGRLLVAENRWFSQRELIKDKIKVFPKFILKEFWRDIKKIDKNKKTYWQDFEK